MSKIELADIKLVDTQTNEEIVYKATTTPKKSTFGNSYFGTLNSRGIAKLQKAGHNIVDETAWCNLLRTTFGLTTDDLGERGPKWDTLEGRQRYKAYVNGAEFAPEFSVKQLARMNAVEQSVPKVSVNVPLPTPQATPQVEIPTPQVQTSAGIAIPPPPVEAVADTTQIAIPQPPVQKKVELTPAEIGYVTLMENYIKEGKFTKEQLISTLSVKVGNDKAEQIYGLAIKPSF